VIDICPLHLNGGIIITSVTTCGAHVVAFAQKPYIFCLCLITLELTVINLAENYLGVLNALNFAAKCSTVSRELRASMWSIG
jgi:hypothetical protein